jgi:hypothetical protein
MKKRSSVDPDGGPDSGFDGNPASNGIEATRQQARIEHFQRQEEIARSIGLAARMCLARGRVSA